MINPRIYYGGTSREQHLKFNHDMQRPVRIASATLAGLIAVWGLRNGWGMLAILWAASIAIVTPLAFQTHEIWASPDNDESEKWKKRHLFAKRYWHRYGKHTKHRSMWSHSLLGSFVRIVYGYWPLLLILLTHPPGVGGPILSCWIVGCLASDICHYLLDDFNLIQMVIGKS